MGLAVPTFTDYSTACGEMPRTFIEMLADCLVTNVDDAGHTHVMVNVLPTQNNCDDLGDFWTCAIGHIDPERAVVENAFALDECGRLGLKILYNLGSNAQ